jgi:beta-lactam-binding protein with PASTA domain
VPRVLGLSLSKAKAKIKKAHCKVGTIKRARSNKVGRVIGQTPKAGKIKPNGFKVKLVVGRR